MKSKPAPAIDPVLPLTPAEQAVVDQINAAIAADPGKKAKYLDQLRSLLETAISVELATIPIYLFTYYSVQRQPTSNHSPMNPPGQPGKGEAPNIPDSVDATRAEQLQIFANRAGATIMSVAVEEMLHMSLSSNMLYAFGGVPELYRRSPGPPNGPHYPVDLPGHAKLGPDHEPLLIPLAPLSFLQLWKFLEIEWPETPGAIPQDQDFETIGQVYAYIRCLVCSHATVGFQFEGIDTQLQPDFYSSNNIDTAYATATFDRSKPAPRPGEHGGGGGFGYPPAARVAKMEDSDDSHAGMTALLCIDSIEKAQQAIATICDQGEGYNPQHIDGTDDPTADEDSHFFKFLCLQSCLEAPAGWSEPDSGLIPPPPGIAPITPAELAYFISPFPANPVTRADKNGGGQAYTDPVHQAISDALNGLYQYMLILTETAFKASGKQQKALFYQGMHMAMIWIMDKLIQSMRVIPLAGGGVLAPTFENIDLGDRSVAFAGLVALQNRATKLIDDWEKQHHSKIYEDLKGYIQMFNTLPDVSAYWKNATAPKFTEVTPPFPPLHACLGLNACKNLGRSDMQNACAGQGFCATADGHSCHVTNNCAGQGGCGLYGTAVEQDNPGGNECKGYGSCATPINAERFSTVGRNQGKSVWALARKRFEERWPAVRELMRKHHVDAPEKLAPAPAPFTETGPSYAWVSQNGCMASCGASGLSGAGSCS